jgi:hypothetical protein
MVTGRRDSGPGGAKVRNGFDLDKLAGGFTETFAAFSRIPSEVVASCGGAGFSG